jgi:hypothetical protein
MVDMGEYFSWFRGELLTLNVVDGGGFVVLLFFNF